MKHPSETDAASDRPGHTHGAPGMPAPDLGLFLNSMDEPLVLLDADCRVRLFNEAALQAFRLIHGALLAPGRTIFEIFRPADREALKPYFASALDGTRIEVQRAHELPDGSVRVFRNILRPLVQEGAITGIIIHSKDVTAQLKAEQGLRESNERFLRAANASFDIIWELDIPSGRVALTENFGRLLGYPGLSEIGVDSFVATFVHPDDAPPLNAAMQRFLAGAGDRMVYPVHRLLKKDGGILYADVSAVLTRDAGGKAFRVTGVSRDITEHYLLEQRLLESNRRFELAAGASHDLVYEINLETGAVIYNEVITELYGYAPGELHQIEHSHRLIHPDDQLLLRTELEQAERAGSTLLHLPLLRLLKKDGTPVNTELKTLLIYDGLGRPLKRVGSARDISWRYAMEQELQKSKERFELAAKASFDLVWERDFTSSTFYFNDAFTQFYGYSAEELKDPDAVFARFPHPDDRGWLQDLVAGFLASDRTHLSYPVHRLLKADGSPVYVEANAVLVRNADGSPQRMIGVSRDITARYLMEQELRESNDRFGRAAQASFDIIWEADVTRNTVLFNEAFYALLGYAPGTRFTPDEFFGDLVHPLDRTAMQEVARCFLAGSSTFIQFPVHRLRRNDGTYIHAEAKALVSRDATGAAYLVTGVTHDVTQRRLNELELGELNKQLKLRAADLEASNSELERFAYVASHDLQEPLRMVSSFMGLLQKRYSAQLDDTARQYIHFAVDGAERMKRLILDLLQFSRIGTQKGPRAAVPLNDLVAELLLEFTFSISERGAEVQVDPLPVVAGYKSGLRQLFQNLLGNALKYNRSTPPRVHIGYCAEERQHRFFVRDNGIGIDPRYFEKIFIIFQQLHTKEEYTGTGIGLAIARKIVDQHGGRIWVESEPGAGSSFYFTIPKTNPNA